MLIYLPDGMHQISHFISQNFFFIDSLLNTFTNLIIWLVVDLHTTVSVSGTKSTALYENIVKFQNVVGITVSRSENTSLWLLHKVVRMTIFNISQKHNRLTKSVFSSFFTMLALSNWVRPMNTINVSFSQSPKFLLLAMIVQH